MGLRLLIISLLTILMLSAISCTDECTDNQSSIGLAGFYDGEANSITIDSVSVYGLNAPNDSMIIKNQKAVQVYLPMPLNSTSCGFVIHYDQRAISDTKYNDTINFKYDAVPYFASVQCGAMYRFKIHEISHTNHFIDSVKMPTMEITNADVETIKIYMRVSQ